MMLGFDTDQPDIFERQVRLVEDAKIIHSSVGMVTAIPKTPLHARMDKAGRLDHADKSEWGTNVIPVSMSREDLRDGYVKVLSELYSAKNYFKRMDSLYLDKALGESKLRSATLRDKPVRYLLACAGALLMTAAVFGSPADGGEGQAAAPRLPCLDLERHPPPAEPFRAANLRAKVGDALPLPPAHLRHDG